MCSSKSIIRLICCCFYLFGLTVPQTLLADELILNNGSRILGTVGKKDNGKLEFKTDFAGTIKVNWTEIEEIHADKPMKVMLEDESIIMTSVIRNTAEVVTLEPEGDAGPVSLAQADLKLINPEDWRLGKGYKLTGHANFAFERQRGNTDKDELDVDGDLTWRRLHDRFIAYGELEHDKNNNKKTADNWKLNGKYHRFFTKKWFYGGIVGLESDDFADLNLRAIAGPLIGYQFFESKPLNLSTEIGLMRVHEDFEEESDNDYTALGWGINFDKYLFDEFMQFYHRQTGLFSFQDHSDIVWDTWTGLRFPLVYGLVASTEIQVEYDGGAVEDADDLDTTYKLKLGYQW
ncbi:MAG: DUF481 domain-containing protein [Pseudomonadota bacterium]